MVLCISAVFLLLQISLSKADSVYCVDWESQIPLYANPVEKTTTL